MTTTEPCRRCGYRIPAYASICPGCGRRHEITAVAPAAAVAAIGGDEPPAPQHSPLLHTARRARRSYVIGLWIAIAFGLSSVARFGVGVDEVAEEIDDDVPGRLTTLTERLGWATLVAVAVGALATALWTRRCHRNVRALGLDEPRRTAWSLAGWLVPGRRARTNKQRVDAMWRDASPAVATLSGPGGSREPVSRVVFRWWSLWLWVPSVAALLVVLLGPGLDDPGIGAELRLTGVAAAAALVATARALYDVVGIVTIAHAHRAEVVRRMPTAEPEVERWTEDQLTAASWGASTD
jgi:hypothetical protein